MIQWFDGTHVIRIELDDTNTRGLRVSVAPADSEDRLTGAFSTLVPGQGSWYKDQLNVFAEALRVVIGRGVN